MLASICGLLLHALPPHVPAAHALSPDPWPEPVSFSAAQLACFRENATSQFREDLRLVTGLHAITGGLPGSFVEIGALDGVRLSNTYMLEHCLGWRGLLIEGNPTNYRHLEQNVANGRRSRVSIVHSAVCAAPGGTLNMTVAGGPVAAVPDTTSSHFTQQWAHVNHPEHTVAVPCRPMSELMADAGLPNATFLSLDVEGAEEIVARTFDAARFKVIMVEADGGDPAKDAAVRHIFESSGMTRMPESYGPSIEFNRQHNYSDNAAASNVLVKNDALAAYENAHALCTPRGWPCQV